MKKIIIAAMTSQKMIGYRGRLPWNIPEEYQHFLDSVRGKTMIMGRKSWEVFGGDVDSQVNIVLSKEETFEGVIMARDIREALAQAEEQGHDCFIAGGAHVYRVALKADQVDEMWLSEVKLELEGDIFFPEFSEEKWVVLEEEDRGEYIFRRWGKSEGSESAALN